jgi:hypothetical protein
MHCHNVKSTSLNKYLVTECDALDVSERDLINCMRFEVLTVVTFENSCFLGCDSIV